MENGWLKLADGKWYYFYSEGQMANGWVKDGGKWYYLSGSGAMVHDRWIQEGNKWYYFGSDGGMLTNTTTRGRLPGWRRRRMAAISDKIRQVL